MRSNEMTIEQLKLIVLKAIEEVGLESFKKTSLFASNDRIIRDRKDAA